MTCLCKHRGEVGVQLHYISNPALELGGKHQKMAFCPWEKFGTRFLGEDPDGTEPFAPTGTQSQDQAARNESLHRPHSPGRLLFL
jgi:hypothetical protein